MPTSLIRPFAAGLLLREDGSFGMADTLGNPMADDAEIIVTAGALAQHLVNHAMAGMNVGRRIGTKAAADVGASLIQATADAATRAGVQAGAEAGVAAGAEHVLANSRIRRELERDADGRVVASVEVREPIPTKGSQ